MLTFMLLPAGYLLFGLSPIDADGWTWALHYVPFYAMTVACEYLVVRRFMPDLSRYVLRSWMLGANAASYAFLLVVTLMGWMWPKTFERMSAMVFTVTTWLVERVLRLAALLQ